MTAMTYNPAVFDVPDEDAARRIILTSEWGHDTDERWARETPYLLDLIGQHVMPNRTRLVIDYGCGIGRISRGLIERFGCRVLGVDLSQEMRTLAPGYVASQGFSVVSLPVFRSLVENGLRADAAVAIWVLQHCWKPAIDVSFLANVLLPRGDLFVVNLNGRAVPAVEKEWANDGLDVKALLGRSFHLRTEGQLEEPHVPRQTRELSFWAHYQRNLASDGEASG